LATCFPTAALLTAEGLTAVTLWALGGADGFSIETHDLRHWVRTADTEVLLAVTARLVASVLVAWLVITTLASLARRVVPALRRAYWLDALTLPAVRRYLDRAAALSLGISTLLGSTASGALTGAASTVTTPEVPTAATRAPGAGAHFSVASDGSFHISATPHPAASTGEATDASSGTAAQISEAPRSPGTAAHETLVIRAPGGADPPEPDRGGDDTPTRTTLPARSAAPPSGTTYAPGTPLPHTTAPATPASGSARRADEAPPKREATARRGNGTGVAHYEVQPGDSLWRIAERRIAAVAPHDSEATIARYWALVVDANRATLRSGDPSLIYAGEIVVLPALGPALP